MTLNELKESLKKILLSAGFKKIENKFYKKGKEFLCEIGLQKSIYGDFCYINYNFYFGDFIKPYIINRSDRNSKPLYLYGRFKFDKKNEICNYLGINEKTLTKFLIKNLEERINPPFNIGKNHFIENIGRLYNTLLENKLVKFLNISMLDVTAFRKSQMLHFYSEKRHYSRLKGIVGSKYNDAVLEIDIEPYPRLPGDTTYSLNESSRQKFAFFANKELWEMVSIGDKITFGSSPMVFYDCPYPIVMLEKGGVKLLEFEKGLKDYIEWIDKTFPIQKD